MKIRVKIGDSLDTINVKGFELKRKRVGFEKVKEGLKTVRYKCRKNKKLAKLDSSKIDFYENISSSKENLIWNDQVYSGEFIIIDSEKSDGCDLVNELDLENYLSSLLSKEMNKSWPIEALKAQAVVARTYAIYKVKLNRAFGKDQLTYDIISSEKHQVSGSLNDQTQKTNTAVKRTKGYVLVSSDGKLVPTFYHSKCGGRTLTPDRVWGNRVKGYKSVGCSFCRKHGNNDWFYNLKNEDLKKIITRAKLDKLIPVRVMGRVSEPDSDIVEVSFHKKKFSIKKSLFRRYLGREKIYSNNFKLKKTKNGYTMYGQGRGHGVGMCQFGALDLAQRGYKFKDILSFYYPNYKLKIVY